MDRPLIIALGSEFRRDDGLGPKVLSTLREVYGESCAYIHSRGEATDLLGEWDNRHVFIIDALKGCENKIGEVKYLDLIKDKDVVLEVMNSSHASGLKEALAFGELYGNQPKTVFFFGIYCSDFSMGVGLSHKVAQGVPHLVSQIKQQLDKTIDTKEKTCTNNH